MKKKTFIILIGILTISAAGTTSAAIHQNHRSENQVISQSTEEECTPVKLSAPKPDTRMEEPSCPGTVPEVSLAAKESRKATGTSNKEELCKLNGHNFQSSVTKPATCEEDGIRTDVCKNCGKKLAKAIPLIGHDYEKAIHEAICEEDGWITYTCRNCRDIFEEEIPAIGHDFVSEITKEATCEEEGELTDTCMNCGETSTEVIYPPGHDYVTEVTEEGEITYLCRICGDSYTETIPDVEQIAELESGDLMDNDTCSDSEYDSNESNN